ncbi:MAG TPA: glycosyltransferase [Segeticoccus sp.]|uniref:glycosyltransferase n=1 Tax=Segeticoccus sp. TaxID=2706531 RepID=UPI002D809D1B|nr:glycosyltransferase [Segeticoccus sp.]HET8599974.1 glycosyltransferase [Segeticoccus sp.]
MVAEVVAGVSLLVWVYLVVGHGRFWRPPALAPVGSDPARWPSVVAILPARNEAEVLPRALAGLVGQDYRGPFRVLVVDDASTDGTGDLAARAGTARVRTDVAHSCGPPAGWSGKVAAMARGVAAAGEPDYLLFTDADIVHPPHSVTRLVQAATERELDLVSQMVRLRTESSWERLLVPAFVYFFAQLYPFPRVNGPGRTAAAAGGCMLVRRAALERAGGLAAIRGALIDDVALGRLLKRGGRTWLGVAPDVLSIRPYPRLADLSQMVARSAYTQLRHSPLLLLGTVVGLLLVYAVPPVALVAGLALGRGLLAALGGAAWLLMSVTYVPLLRLHRVPSWWAPVLPLVAVLYAGMTVDSAWRHLRGRGGAWKGRVIPSRAAAPRR